MASDPEPTLAPCLNLYLYFKERVRAGEAEKHRERADEYRASVQNNPRP